MRESGKRKHTESYEEKSKKIKEAPQQHPRIHPMYLHNVNSFALVTHIYASRCTYPHENPTINWYSLQPANKLIRWMTCQRSATTSPASRGSMLMLRSTLPTLPSPAKRTPTCTSGTRLAYICLVLHKSYKSYINPLNL